VEVGKRGGQTSITGTVAVWSPAEHERNQAPAATRRRSARARRLAAPAGARRRAARSPDVGDGQVFQITDEGRRNRSRSIRSRAARRADRRPAPLRRFTRPSKGCRRRRCGHRRRRDCSRLKLGDTARMNSPSLSNGSLIDCKRKVARARPGRAPLKRRLGRRPASPPIVEPLKRRLGRRPASPPIVEPLKRRLGRRPASPPIVEPLKRRLGRRPASPPIVEPLKRRLGRRPASPPTAGRALRASSDDWPVSRQPASPTWASDRRNVFFLAMGKTDPTVKQVSWWKRNFSNVMATRMSVAGEVR